MNVRIIYEYNFGSLNNQQTQQKEFAEIKFKVYREIKTNLHLIFFCLYLESLPMVGKDQQSKAVYIMTGSLLDYWSTKG